MILIPQYRTARRVALVKPLNLVFEGDSITYGYPVTDQKSFANIYGGTANLAVSSSTIEGAAPSLTDRAATLDALIDPDRRNVLVVMTGNDMILDTAATMLTRMATYLDLRRAAGWYVIIWTVLPRSAGGGGAGFNPRRNTANTTLRTWVGTHCDAIVDFDLMPMGPDAAASDTSLYSDGIHPTLAGHRLLFDYIRTSLDAISVPATTAPTTDLVEHWKLNTGLTQAAGVASAWKGVRKGYILSSSGTSQPAVQGDGSLLFDGSNDWMNALFAWSPDGFTVCLLAKQLSWAANDCIMDGGAVAFSGGIFQSSSTPQIGGYNGTFTTRNGDWALNTYATVIMTLSGSGCLSQIGTATEVTSAGLAPKKMGGITLGATAALGQSANIQVKEVLIYRGSLDSTARAAVLAYFATV